MELKKKRQKDSKKKMINNCLHLKREENKADHVINTDIKKRKKEDKRLKGVLERVSHAGITLSQNYHLVTVTVYIV